MDSVSVSRRNYSKKGNKENSQPTQESKSFIRKDVSKTTTSVAPLQLKGNEKETTSRKDGPCKVKPRRGDVKLTSGQTVKKVQRDEKGAAAKPATCSQVFFTAQTVKHRKLVAEAPKPPATVSSKSAPGMYKGKIIQSKIGSIWRSGATAGEAVPKSSSAPTTESQKVGNVSKSRSNSVTEMPWRGIQKPRPAPGRSKSVSDGSTTVSKPAVTRRPAARVHSAVPPARTIPATLKVPSSRNATKMPPKGRGAVNSKPKVLNTDKKVSKPPVSSTLSQYRFSMETAEERRAKLAGWLESKGKALKRPAMTTTAAPKTKPQPLTEPQPAVLPVSETQVLGDDAAAAAAAQCTDTWGAGMASGGLSQLISNTSLDLLDNSDGDLPVSQQVDDIVVNLCDALDAMATPSRYEDEPAQMTDECHDAGTDCRPKGECEDVTEERTEDVVEEVKDETDLKVEEDAEEDYNDDWVMETTPQVDEASVVKYSVKTTPFLQSVRKTIEGEASVSKSRQKSNIKDLKFLTPVRRSCRIQRKSSHLPAMLVDHDPCVSSLAELVKLDDEANAYIYRRNPALLEDLPDQDRP
ncbi:cytoskeleton-associated protein 2 [Genypterus blacodes]|uniref:cytoskeleton-associated protein 2 n=1 Tax=Genypterus blacodes TaxID=154954 RepID=UPI003F75915A